MKRLGRVAGIGLALTLLLGATAQAHAGEPQNAPYASWYHPVPRSHTDCPIRVARGIHGVAAGPSAHLACGQWLHVTWHGRTVDAFVIEHDPSMIALEPIRLASRVAKELGGKFTRRDVTYTTWDLVLG